jgi:hypothetical protein
MPSGGQSLRFGFTCNSHPTKMQAFGSPATQMTWKVYKEAWNAERLYDAHAGIVSV